jgi:hypothetical protein
MDAGMKVGSIASDLVRKYDRDGSGSIRLADASELTRIDESNDGGSGHRATVSGARMFRAADRGGNGDGIATVAELTALAARYDTGSIFAPQHAGDGALDGLELLRATTETGEEITGFVGGTRGQDGGGAFLAANQSGGLLVAASPQGGLVLGGNQQGGFASIGDAIRGLFASRSGSSPWSGFSWG